MYYTELVIRLILNPREISGRLFTGIVIEDIGDLLLIGIFELAYGLMLYSIVASPSGPTSGGFGTWLYYSALGSFGGVIILFVGMLWKINSDDKVSRFNLVGILLFALPSLILVYGILGGSFP